MIRKCLSILLLIMLTLTMNVWAGEDNPAVVKEIDASPVNGENISVVDTTRSHRNELEQQQIMSYNPDIQMELSSLFTDLSTEPEEIKSKGMEVLNHLANAESYNALIIILGDAWYPTMLTDDLIIGQRNYHYENPAGPVLSGDITVLSDEFGDKYTFVRTISQKYGLTYLEISPEAIRFLLNNGPETEQYYVAQTLYTDDGTFISNEGFVNEKDQAINNLIVYTSDLHLRNEPDEAGVHGFSLIGAWATRFDQGLTYNGIFDQSGKTLVETPKELDGEVCYALQDTDGETLYLSIEGDRDHIFIGEEFGLYTVWDE